MLADIHRHLGGSIKPEFVWDNIIKDNNRYRYLAESVQDLYGLMKCDMVKDRTMKAFLDKFRILDEIVWTEDLIDKSIKHVVDGIREEGLYGALIDFSINKYMRIGWHKTEAIKFIYDSFKRYADGIKIGLILSIKYESYPLSIEQYSRVIENDGIAECLCGIDFVGDENFYGNQVKPDTLQSLLRNWINNGKMVRAHVGEVGPIDNIESAIDVMKVTHIAHGIKITSDTKVIQKAIDNNIQFDLGISGNNYTGVSDISRHPVAEMLKQKLKITIGTDDPVQFDTTIHKEFDLLRNILKDQLPNSGYINNIMEVVRLNAIDSVNRYANIN